MISPRSIPRRLVCGALSLLLSAAFASLAQAVNEAGGFVAFEAESSTANISPRSGFSWAAGSAITGFGGSGYMEATPNNGTTIDANWTTTSPELQFAVNFSTAGTYYVWVRGYASVNGDSSVHAGLDGTSTIAARIVLPQFNTWKWTNTTTSGSHATIVVSATGAHTFSLWMREDGMRLDKVILTTNPNYTPELTSGFWRSQNIYQIITDRFFNGDASNDNAAGNHFPSNGGQVHGGDFKGIEQKLDYIKALGATAIWISPVVLNGNGDYHGYAGRDFYSVDPHWGSLADLQRMVQEAHRRGILVIDDVVVNHGADLIDSANASYPAFLAPPAGYSMRFRNSAKQYPAPFDINATNPTIESLFHNNGQIDNFGDGTQVQVGELSGLDDFKTESAYVQASMAAIYKYWLEQVRFDGFRVDTVKHVDQSFWQSWCPAIRLDGATTNTPNFFICGEVYDGSDAKCGSYTGTQAGGTFEMDSVVDYPLYFLVNSVFATASGNTQQLENRYAGLAGNYDSAAQNQLVTFLDNHDQPRFLSAANANGNVARLEVALAFLYTSRGIPCLYYGTEQDFDGGSDPDNREDMFAGLFEQGPSAGDDFNMASPRFQLVAKLNNFRRLYPALCSGTHVNQWSNSTGPGLFSYSRQLGNQEVFVVLNTSSSPQTLPSRPTIYPSGTVVTNLLNPAETLTVTSTSQFPSVSVPGAAAKIFIAQSTVLPLDPVVTSIAPVHDAGGVATTSPIVITFSKPMNTGSIEAAFSTTPSTAGSFAWSGSNDTLTYTPTGGLATQTLYTVRISAGATDSVSGNAMFAPFEARFTTGSSSSSSSPPTATTNSASGIGNNGATLNGTVNPSGSATSVYFQYGFTKSYTFTTGTQNIVSGSVPFAVSSSASGLIPARTYHFRVVATNANGTTYGADQTFVTTSSSPPTTATTQAASNVTVSSATLNGTVNPAGNATSVQFFYGVQPNSLTGTTTLQSIGSGTGNIVLSATATGLSPNTTYYFLVSATNVTGITNGSTLVFTTPPRTPAISTGTAGAISTTGATLTGIANPNGSATFARFQYGLTGTYGNTTTQFAAGSGSGDVALSATLSALSPGTIYHYRLTGSNTYGTTYGADQMFTTAYIAPSVTTATASAIGSSPTQAMLSGFFNPNGSPARGWFEYGPTILYGSSTRPQAADNAESYSAWDFTTNSSGGSGLGAATYLEGVGGGGFLVSASTGGRQIVGAKSFGVYAGSGGQAACRSLSSPRAVGTLTCSARFDVTNAFGFSGFNLKSAQGASFGAGELLSFGIAPITGNNAIYVHGSTETSINLGSEIRGSVIDFTLDYDTGAGTYTLGAKFSASVSYTTISGQLQSSGATATHLGFANFNNDGANQNLIFDSIQWTGADSIGSGTASATFSTAVAGLSPNAVRHFRAVAQGLGGVAYGADQIFTTNIVTVSASTPDAYEFKSVPGVFTIAQTGTSLLSVNYNIAGNAVAGTRYSLPASPLVTGSGSAALSAVPVSNNFYDSDQNVLLTLASGTGYLVGSGSSAGVTIHDKPFDSWKAARFGADANNPAVSGDMVIHNSAGIPNLLAYAFGADPWTATTSCLPTFKTIALSGTGYLTLNFTRAAAALDVTLAVEANGNILNPNGWTAISSWSAGNWTPSALVTETGTTPLINVQVRDSLPVGSSTQRFLRLKVGR